MGILFIVSVCELKNFFYWKLTKEDGTSPKVVVVNLIDDIVFPVVAAAAAAAAVVVVAAVVDTTIDVKDIKSKSQLYLFHSLKLFLNFSYSWSYLGTRLRSNWFATHSQKIIFVRFFICGNPKLHCSLHIYSFYFNIVWCVRKALPGLFWLTGVVAGVVVGHNGHEGHEGNDEAVPDSNDEDVPGSQTTPAPSELSQLSVLVFGQSLMEDSSPRHLTLLKEKADPETGP